MATTYGTIPKGLKHLVNDPRVEEVGEEGEDGYWIYLMPGWCSEPGLHAVHEWTVKETLAGFRWIEKCEAGCTCNWDKPGAKRRPEAP